MAAKIRSTSFALTNNLRGQEAIGSLGYIGIALGRLEITGNIELYFENADEYTTFLNNQDIGSLVALITRRGGSGGTK